MNNNNLSHTLLSRLKVPEQTLDKLSFCKSPTVRHVQHWINTLPATQTGFVANILCTALPELIQLKVAPQTRLQLLETVRPAVQDCITRLSRDFLHQPLELPEFARKAATAAQVLQKHLGNAYILAVQELILTGKHLEKLPLAMHRALTCHSLFIWRGYLLYVPIAPQVWLETHTLYHLAEHLNISTHSVSDALPHYGHVKTIEQAYLRIVLLSAAQPNHLRQQELIDAYYALEKLAPYAKLEPSDRDHKHNVHAVMLYSVEPPVHQTRLPYNYEHQKRSINTDALISHLNDKNFTMSDNHQRTNGLTPSLIKTLALVWSKSLKRKNERYKSKEKIDIIIGLTCIHFYIAKAQPFKEFLQHNNVVESHEMLVVDDADHDNPSDVKRPSFDPSNVDFGSGISSTDTTIKSSRLNPHQKQYPIYNINIADYSDNGYYLRWQQGTPNQLAPGEIVALRQSGQALWAIGAIIWIRHTRGIAHSGIKILGHSAEPIAVIPKTSQKREYLRALKLPKTLVTNSIGFHEYDQVDMYQASGSTSVQLAKRLFGTGVISEFAYRELGQDTENPENEDS